MLRRRVAPALAALLIACGGPGSTEPHTTAAATSSAPTSAPSPVAATVGAGSRSPAASAATTTAVTTLTPAPAPAATAAAPATTAPATTVPTPTPTAAPTQAPTAVARATSDRPDELTGAQIHVMYVLPSDGTDEQLDTTGRIANAVSAMQLWLRLQTGGRTLRVDTFGGRPDITFFRMPQTDANIAASGAFVRDRIEAELKSAGLVRPDRIYAVYYGGSSTYACGGGAWPPVLPGVVAAQYLKGVVPGATPCAANPVGASSVVPGYQEYAMLHELMHTMGMVGSCAPHHTRAGHTSEDPRDLMYAGDQPWLPSMLDVGRDDYYGHSVPGCPDLAKSAYLSG